MIQIQLFLLAIAISLSGCGTAKTARTGSTPRVAPSFGIYLVQRPPDQPWTESTQDHLAALKLAGEPVISDKDILSYDLATHTMRLRPSALTRLPRPPVSHLPFVVVASGERIYLGAFSTELSSRSLAIPSITVDARAGTNTLQINRAYPTPSFATGPDPRSDPRIRKALAALDKIR